MSCFKAVKVNGRFQCVKKNGAVWRPVAIHNFCYWLPRVIFPPKSSQKNVKLYLFRMSLWVFCSVLAVIESRISETKTCRKNTPAWKKKICEYSLSNKISVCVEGLLCDSRPTAMFQYSWHKYKPENCSLGKLRVLYAGFTNIKCPGRGWGGTIWKSSEKESTQPWFGSKPTKTGISRHFEDKYSSLFWSILSTMWISSRKINLNR